MALPFPAPYPPDSVEYRIAQTQARLQDIASLRHSVIGSRRTMAEAQEAIGRADEVLAWRLSNARAHARG